LYFSRKIKKKVSYGGKICCIFLVFSLYFLEKYKVLRNTANQRPFSLIILLYENIVSDIFLSRKRKNTGERKIQELV